MTTPNYSCTVVAVVDRTPDQVAAAGLGRAAAGDHLLAAVVHDNRFGITATLDDELDPLDGLTWLRNRFSVVLRNHGITVTGWASLEALAADEVDRRIAASSMPELINTKAFAEECGVSPQRISELETERKAAAAEGREHPFPTPVVPGWWIKTAAQQYAATRKRKPGPAPKRDNPLHRAARRPHGQLPDAE